MDLSNLTRRYAYKVMLFFCITIIGASILMMHNIDAISTAEASKFGLSGTNPNDQTTKMKNMLSSDFDIINLSSGTYVISNTLFITQGKRKKVIGGPNTIISINLPASDEFLNSTINISFENITFDFNEGNVRSVLSYGEGMGTISLKNLKFTHIRDTNPTTSSTLINIAASGNVVDIDGIEFSYIYKKGNGIIGDGGGNFTGIYLATRETNAGAQGKINNITFKEIHNIDVNGNIVMEDTSGIYISSGYTKTDSSLEINNVTGYNSGKRLIKIDAKNIFIKKVRSYNQYSDQLTCIGLNDGVVVSGNITISDVVVTGIGNIGIAITGDGVILNDITVDLKQGDWEDAFGLFIAGSNITMDNMKIKADRGVLFHSTKAVIKNIRITNSKFVIPETGTQTFHVNESSYGFDNIHIENVESKFLNKEKSKITFFQAIGLTGNAEKSGKRLVIKNCHVLSNSNRGFGVTITNVTDFEIQDFIFETYASVLGHSAIYFYNCSNGKIDNVETKADAYLTLRIDKSESITIDTIIAHNINSFYITESNEVTMANTKIVNSKFSDVDWSKTQLVNALNEFGDLIKGVITENRILFKPESNITRAEAVVLLARLKGISESILIADQNVLSDVKGTWYEKTAHNAYTSGLIRGDSNSKFNGESLLTQEQLITMLVRLYMREDEVIKEFGSNWPSNYIEAGKKVGVISENEIFSNLQATREYTILKYIIPFRSNVF